MITIELYKKNSVAMVTDNFDRLEFEARPVTCGKENSVPITFIIGS